MKKRLLVDLSSLKNKYSGLGQIAFSYGTYFKEHYRKEDAPYELTLLLPKKYFGLFGNEVHYVSSTNLIRKHLRFLFPKFDIWHSTNQLSRFRPNDQETKLILTIHDLNFLYEKTEGARTRRIKKIQEKIQRANEIVCISHFTKNEVECNLQLNEKKCRVIYNKVNLLDESLAQKPDSLIKEPFFFTMGVINRKKNFHVLLDMMKLMPEKHLYIVGMKADEKKNLYAKSIKERIENEQIHNVTLRGPVSHREKIWMYKHCEAFLFPSLLEGFGMPVIEAMQFGKPVFSSHETSLREIGSEFAYFWDNFNPEEMKQLIDENLTHFYLNISLSDKEKEYARSFANEKHFEEYEALYRSV